MRLRKLELTWIGKVHAQMQEHHEKPAATYGPNRTLSGLVAKHRESRARQFPAPVASATPPT